MNEEVARALTEVANRLEALTKAVESFEHVLREQTTVAQKYEQTLERLAPEGSE